MVNPIISKKDRDALSSNLQSIDLSLFFIFDQQILRKSPKFQKSTNGSALVEQVRWAIHLLRKRKPMTRPVYREKPSERPVVKVQGKLRKNSAITSPSYSTKIIKAGALIPDTKALLSVWDPRLSVSENLRLMRHHNLLGKTTRSRAKDILAIFRQRYLSDENNARALATIVRRQFDGNTLDRILYFHAARADSLLHDVVVDLLVPHWSRGTMEIDVREIELTLRKWVEEGKTSGSWCDNTIRRVSQGVLSTLRDFGVLQGSLIKRIAPAYLSVQAFAYIAFYLKQHQPSGIKLLDLVDWKLFFLPREGVERFLLEAHQHGLLEYHVAGSVTRLSFPATTIEEYANVLTQ